MKTRHFFWAYFLLFTLVSLACDIHTASSNVTRKSILLTYSQSGDDSYQFPDEPESDLVKEHESNSLKHCEIVEVPTILIPISHELKNKYASRFKYHFIIYLNRVKSMLDIKNHVFSSTLIISPLSVILQI